MRTHLRSSTEYRRRSSGMCLATDAGSSTLDAKMRRGSNASATNSQFLTVPDLKHRRKSTSTSTSSLLGIVEGSRKRGSLTSSSATGSLLCVPQMGEPRRRSLPGYIESSCTDHTSLLCTTRRRSSVCPRDDPNEVNNAGARKMKIFGLILFVFLVTVLGVSFLKLLYDTR